MDTTGLTYILLSAGSAIIGTSLRVSNTQDALVGATIFEGGSVVFSTMLSIRENGSSSLLGSLRPTLGLILDVFWGFSTSLYTLERPVLFPKPGKLRASISGVFGILGVMLKLRKTSAFKNAGIVFDIAAILFSLSLQISLDRSTGPELRTSRWLLTAKICGAVIGILGILLGIGDGLPFEMAGWACSVVSISLSFGISVSESEAAERPEGLEADMEMEVFVDA